jgi:intraflagellar transport protein 88
VLAAARLVAPSMNSKELIDALKDGHEQVAMRMEHEQAVHLLKNNGMKIAVKTLKSLEAKSREMKALVATNLSLIHFLEGDVDIASSYADIALDADRYNAKALVNKGNCFFASEDYASAKDLYLEAVGVEAGCAQAIFNLGLSNVRLQEPEEAIQAFEKLHSITPNSPTVIYHIADINENRGQSQNAMKWFNVLAASQSSDSTILSRLAYLYAKSKDDSQSLHYHLESFRHFPVDLDVIAWIGAWFVQREMFDRSIYFFQQAALVQPKEIKWGA